MKRTISSVISVALILSSYTPVVTTAETADTKWERFLKYDLCISDYSSLSEEDQQLCHFIYDTEQAANDDIICERARRTLAGDDVGERITLEQLDGAYGLWDKYADHKNEGWQYYIHCVPDVIHLAEPGNSIDSAYYSYCIYQRNEYWLDDTGETYVVFRPKNSKEEINMFEVYDQSSGRAKRIPAATNNTPYKDYRTNEKSLNDFGCIEKNGGYYYTKPDGTAVFAWSIYSNKPDSLPVTEPFIIESEIDGCPVTAIENNALCYSPFTEVVLPDSIETIDEYAFGGSTYLKIINIPEKTKYIGMGAFQGCEALENINIDRPELTISASAFAECYNLKEAKLRVKVLGEGAFYGCKKLESITLEDGIEVIKKNVFSYCNLKDVKLPNSVKYIEQGAFYNKFGSRVKAVTIPASVCLIGAYPRKTGVMETSGLEPPKPIRPLTDEPVCVFDSDCVIYGYKGTEAERYADEWGLTFVSADEVKTDYEGNKYYEAADGNLLYWVYPDHAAVRSNYEITDSGEYIIKTSGDIVIPSEFRGVPVTGVFGFGGAQELTSITLPDTITKIADNAFLDCTSLETINVPKSVNRVGYDAFVGTAWLENKLKESPLVILNGVLVDGHKCEGEVVIPDNVTRIADRAFMDCQSIESVSIPDSVEYIGRQAFYNTGWLNKLSAENKLVIVNGFLLNGNNCGEKLVIPDTVKSINGQSFVGVDTLQSVTIPKSVKHIGLAAFYMCPELESVTILSPDCEIESYIAFSNGRREESGDVYFDGTIYGYDGSTAQAYAEKYGYKFKSLGEAPNEENMVIPAEKDGKAVESVSIKDNPDVKTVTIPETVKSIKVENCPNITSFVVDGNNPYLCSIDGVVYNKNITVLLCYPANKPETSFETPVSVTEIASFAFDRSHNLEHLSLPGVVKIDERALANAYISSVSFSENLTDIGNMGFAYNKALTRVVLPSSLKRAIFPFYECTSLSEIVILHKGINEEPWAATIDPELDSYSTLLGGCKNVTVYIPDEDYGFYKKEYESGFWDTSCVLLKLSEYDGITTPGDANCDGNVNIADAVLVMQVATNPDKYAQGKSEYSITAQGEKNADVDGKAGLSNSDALLIQKFKLGLIKEF